MPVARRTKREKAKASLKPKSSATSSSGRVVGEQPFDDAAGELALVPGARGAAEVGAEAAGEVLAADADRVGEPGDVGAAGRRELEPGDRRLPAARGGGGAFDRVPVDRQAAAEVQAQQALDDQPVARGAQGDRVARGRLGVGQVCRRCRAAVERAVEHVDPAGPSRRKWKPTRRRPGGELEAVEPARRQQQRRARAAAASRDARARRPRGCRRRESAGIRNRRWNGIALRPRWRSTKWVRRACGQTSRRRVARALPARLVLDAPRSSWPPARRLGERDPGGAEVGPDEHQVHVRRVRTGWIQPCLDGHRA